MAPKIYPTVAETIEAHRLLIEEFGGHHGIRDPGLLESAVFRPQNGYYNNLIEEASALMEFLANNHAFIDGNKRISFVMTDVLLRLNGYFLDVEPLEAHKLITQAMEKNEFRFPMIRDWIVSVVKPLEEDE
ncbi:MAG: type II toxin-antitoxin system death-on-curing family toxin [Candidatus Acidiferrales bacterium]